MTLQFVEALRYAAEMESAFGDNATGRVISRRSDRTSQACISSAGISSTVSSRIRQRKNISASTPTSSPSGSMSSRAHSSKTVLTTILSADRRRLHSRPQTVPPMTTATYYFRFYLGASTRTRRHGRRYLGLLGPWRQMVSLGLTHLGRKARNRRAPTLTPGARIPNYDFLTIVAGIRPGTPGFATVTVAPHLGPLKHVSAAMPSPKGTIEAEYTVEQSTVRAVINLPVGLSGELLWNGKSLKLHEGRQELRLKVE